MDYIFHCKYSLHLSCTIFDIFDIEHVVMLKISLEITQSANLCAICTLLKCRPEAVFSR